MLPAVNMQILVNILPSSRKISGMKSVLKISKVAVVWRLIRLKEAMKYRLIASTVSSMAMRHMLFTCFLFLFLSTDWL